MRAQRTASTVIIFGQRPNGRTCRFLHEPEVCRGIEAPAESSHLWFGLRPRISRICTNRKISIFVKIRAIRGKKPTNRKHSNYFWPATQRTNLPISSWARSLSTELKFRPSSFSLGMRSWIWRWQSLQTDIVCAIWARVKFFLNHLFLWHVRGIKWCSVVPDLVSRWQRRQATGAKFFLDRI